MMSERTAWLVVLVVTVAGSSPICGLQLPAESDHIDHVLTAAVSFRHTSKGRVVSVDERFQIPLLLRQQLLCNASSSSPASHTGDGEAGTSSEERKTCPVVWDRLQCWPETAAGQLAIQPCAHYVDNFIIDANATRQCMANGSWFFNLTSNRTWSNYTACVNDERPTLPTVHPMFAVHVRYVRVIYLVGYSISLLALTVAVAIMLHIKKLHCPRNTVHVNLFFSFLLRCVMALVRDLLMADGVGIRGDNISYSDGLRFDHSTSVWKCRVVMILFNYATTANYSWIFIEGLYLHMLLFVAVFSENTGVRWYIVSGWTGPLVCIVAWIIAKTLVADPLCWDTYLTGAGVIWIIAAPVLLTIVVNFIFFINIIYSLFNKLKAFNTQDSYKHRHRRLAKSALVLIPLFGVPYMLFLAVPSQYIDPTLEIVKLYFEMTFNSFNGFLVSLLYCFLNAEVQVEVRKKWQHLSLTGFGSGLTSRRLATTTTTYAAVPGNESGVGQTGPGPADGRQLPAQQPPRRHQDHQQMDHPGRNSATEPMPASRPAELRDSSCQWHQTEAAAAGQQQE